MLYDLHFFSSKCSSFHNATLFGFCITHILNTGCAKIWKKIHHQKVKKTVTEKYQFEVFHCVFIIMVCTVSSDWIKLAGQKLDRDLHHITVAHLYPMCMYCLHNSVMWLIIQKKNLFGYGMLWASNFSEVFWSGKVFYLIIKSCIDNFTMQHWSGCSIHIISNKEVPYWHVKSIILTLTCVSVVLFELFLLSLMW